MTELTLQDPPKVECSMRICVPAETAYQAFVDPNVTTQFWFTRSDGPLEVGKTVEWYWDQFGVSGPVNVLELQENSHILFDWGEGDDQSLVHLTFTERNDQSTIVNVVNSGFRGNGDQAVKGALDSMSGWTVVLANAKAFLEHGLKLNLIEDRHAQPDAL